MSAATLCNKLRRQEPEEREAFYGHFRTEGIVQYIHQQQNNAQIGYDSFCDKKLPFFLRYETISQFISIWSLK